MSVSATNEDAPGTRRLAAWSLGLGITGILMAIIGIGVLLALAAIYCGIVALARMRRWHPHDGHGFALSGIILGVAALLAFPLLLATVVPRLIAMRQAQHHEECFANLQRIELVKEDWMRAHHATNGTPMSPQALQSSELSSATRLECPEGGRYRLNPVGKRPACSIVRHNEPPTHTR